MLKIPKVLILGCILATGSFAADVACSIVDVCSSEGQVVLLCKERMVLLGNSEGQSWQEQQLPADTEPLAIRFLDAQKGFVAGKGGMLLTTEDGGHNWRQITVPANEHLTSIYFVGTEGWIAGWGGVILHSADRGDTWVLQETPGAQGLESIFFTDPDHGWAVGWVGTILRTTDGGGTWEEIEAEAARWTLFDVFFRDQNNGWAVGFGGEILRSTDGGVTWTEQESGVTSSLTAVLFDESGEGWITTPEGMLLSKDGGESWESVVLGQGLFLTQVLPVGDSLWAAGARGILKETDGQFSRIWPAS